MNLSESEKHACMFLRAGKFMNGGAFANGAAERCEDVKKERNSQQEGFFFFQNGVR